MLAPILALPCLFNADQFRQELDPPGEPTRIMLFKRAILQAIARGDVTLAFRRWKRPCVRVGTLLRTEVGVLAVESLEAVLDSAVSDQDARRAGFSNRLALLSELRSDPQANLYRIGLRMEGPDPRIALRDNTDLSEAALRQVKEQLDRWDKSSARGPWTFEVLRTIADLPQQSSTELAQRLQMDRDWFKVQVRKLKELGLTESLHPGYRLSQRGLALLLSVKPEPSCE